MYSPFFFFIFSYSLTRSKNVMEHKFCLKFSQDIAQGMQYLSMKGYVHRDLAARNVVLAGITCKVRTPLHFMEVRIFVFNSDSFDCRILVEYSTVEIISWWSV